MRRSALLAALAVVLGSCVPAAVPEPPVATGTPPPILASPSPAATTLDMTATLLAKPLPYADGFVLTRTVRGRDGVPAKGFEPVRTTPPDERIGSFREFWTYDFAAKKNVKTTATLQLMTDHAKWWIGNDATVDLGALRATATEFESKIYPTAACTARSGRRGSTGIRASTLSSPGYPAPPPGISAARTRSPLG